MECTVRRSLSASDGAVKVIGVPERLRVARLRKTICPDFTDRVSVAYEQHYQALYRYLLLTGSSPDEAQDIIQQGFIRLIQILQDGDPVDQPKSWLMRVVHNIRVDRYRKKKREIAFLISTLSLMRRSTAGTTTYMAARPKSTIQGISGTSCLS